MGEPVLPFWAVKLFAVVYTIYTTIALYMQIISWRIENYLNKLLQNILAFSVVFSLAMRSISMCLNAVDVNLLFSTKL